MAYIEDGGGSGRKADVTSNNALVVTPIDANGNQLNPAPTGCYMLPLYWRHTAATGAGATVFAMRNTVGALTAKLRRIVLTMGFDGTAVAATSMRYTLMRFNTATPTIGTALTVVKKRSSYPASNIGDARFKADAVAGLTVTSVVFETPFAALVLPVPTTGFNVQLAINFIQPGQSFSPFELASGEGLAIQVDTTAAIIGLSGSGFIEWDE